MPTERFEHLENQLTQVIQYIGTMQQHVVGVEQKVTGIEQKIGLRQCIASVRIK